VREEDWQRAGALMDMSSATYRSLLTCSAGAAAQGNLMRGRAEGEREVVKAGVLRGAAVRRVAGVIMRKIAGTGRRREARCARRWPA